MRRNQPQEGSGAAVPNAIHFTALARAALLGVPVREARLGTVQALLLRAEEILQQVNRDNVAAMNNLDWNQFDSMNSTAASLPYVSPTHGQVSQRTPQLPQHSSTPIDRIPTDNYCGNLAAQTQLNRTYTVNNSNRVNSQPVGGGCCRVGTSCGQSQQPTSSTSQGQRQVLLSQRGLPTGPQRPIGNSCLDATLHIYPDQPTPFRSQNQNYQPFSAGRRAPNLGAAGGYSPPPYCGFVTPTPPRPHTSPPAANNNGVIDLVSPSSEIRNVSNLSQGSILTCPYCNQELEVDINVDVLANDSTYLGQTEADVNVRIEFPTADTVGSANNELRCPHCRRIIEMRLNVRSNTNPQDHNSFTVRLDLVQQGAPPPVAASMLGSSVEHVFQLAAAGDSSRNHFSELPGIAGAGCQERPSSKGGK